jgi:hypothetical protein
MNQYILFILIGILMIIFIETKSYSIKNSKESFLTKKATKVCMALHGKNIQNSGYKEDKITTLVSQLEKDVDEVSLDLRRMKQKFGPVYKMYLEIGKERAAQQKDMKQELHGFKKDMSTKMGKELSKVLNMSPKKGEKLMNQFLEQPNLNDTENKRLMKFQKKLLKQNLSGDDAKVDYTNSAFQNIRKILKKQGLN